MILLYYYTYCQLNFSLSWNQYFFIKPPLKSVGIFLVR